jgi:hypothetical protein
LSESKFTGDAGSPPDPRRAKYLAGAKAILTFGRGFSQPGLDGRKIKIKSRGTKLDFTQTAAAVVSQSIGENLFDGSPLPDPNAGKDPKAIERGRQGGLKGGKARASKLTAKRRKQIASKVAKSRWGK